MSQFDFSDAVNPFEKAPTEKPAQPEAFDFSDAVNPFEKERSWGDAASDTGKAIMGGFASMGSGLAQAGDVALRGVTYPQRKILHGVDEALGKAGFDSNLGESADAAVDAAGGAYRNVTRDAAESWEQSKSPQMQQAKRALGKAEGVVGTLQAVKENPMVLGDILAGSAPMMLAPGGAAARAGQSAMKAALAKGVSRVAAETAAKKAATQAAIVSGGALEGATAGSDAYNAVSGMTPEELIAGSEKYRELIESGVPHEKAVRDLAFNAGLTAQAIQTPISMLMSAATGAGRVEADFFTGEGVRNLFAAMAKETAEEIGQEAGAQFAQNVGVSEFADDSRGYGEGVAKAGTLGAIAGATQGGAMKALGGLIPKTTPEVNAQADAMEADLDRDQSVEDEWAELQRELEADLNDLDKAEQFLLGHNPDPMLVSPDGEAGSAEQFKEAQREQIAARHPAYPQDVPEPNPNDRTLPAINQDGSVDFQPTEVPEAPEEQPYQYEGALEWAAPPWEQAQEQAAPGLTLEPKESETPVFETEVAPRYENGIDFVNEKAMDEALSSAWDSEKGAPVDIAARDALAKPIEDAIAARVEARRDEKLPEGLKDPRLLRDEFRGHLQAMADDLVKGGGIAYTWDSQGNIKGRTPSLNPDWFQSIDDGLSVEDARKAVAKALNAEKLGVRQARVVGAMLDEVTGKRGEHATQLRFERQQAIDLKRRQLPTWEEFVAQRTEEIPAAAKPEVAGEVFEEQDYTPEATFLDRSVSELAQHAIDAGADWNQVDAIVDNADTDSVLSSLQQLIFGLRNDHRQDTETATRSESGESPTEAVADPQTDPAPILESYSEEELTARQEAVDASARAERAADKKAEIDDKSKSFTLAGSNLPADQAAAAGQGNLLDNAAASEPEAKGELVDESDPVEATKANLAGQGGDSQQLIVLRDMLESATDIMNGESLSPKGNALAEAIIEEIDGALDSDGDVPKIKASVLASLRELLGNEIENDNATELQSVADAIEQSLGLDFQASKAATSPTNSLPEPTEAQIEAGNYKKAHVKVQGLDIAIENPKGSTRSGTDPNGKDWSVTMASHYGYIKRSTGADGEHVDVFVGPNPDSGKVFVVDQVNADGSFDEHKVMLGYDSKLKARAGYKANYSDGWKVGPVTAMSMDEFKAWLQDNATKPLNAEFFAGASESVKLPTGFRFVRGAGHNADKWGVAKDGDGVAIANYHATKDQAAKEFSSNQKQEQAWEAEDRRRKQAEAAVAKRLLSGEEATDADLKLLDLKAKSRFDYLSPVVQRLFGISKMRVRRAMGDALFEKTSDFGSKSTWGRSKAALSNAAKFARQGSEPQSAASGEQPAFAVDDTNKSSDADPIARGQSNEDVATSNPESQKSASEQKLEDFGEELPGAKKHTAWIDKLGEEIDIRSQPLSKSFPHPDYEQMAADGVDPELLALVAMMRAEIPSRPKKYTVDRWAKQVESIRGLAHKIVTGEYTKAHLIEKLRDINGLNRIPAALEVVKRLPPEKLKDLGGWRLSHAHFSLYNGKKDVDIWLTEEVSNGRHKQREGFEDKNDALKYIEQQILQSSDSPQPPMKFEIRGRNGRYFINKVGDKEYRPLKTFAELSEAREFLRDHHDEVVAEWEKVKERFNVKKSDLRSKRNRETSSKDYRNGKDITPDQFSDAFGFRGVQFGNWVKQGDGGRDRQGMLNRAYDALMDLADVVGIEPKAISLNGELGLAFGARGGGWGAAHYEPGQIVINLTKTQGAGSLAHEWFHALDHYFARFREPSGSNDREDSYITYKPEPLYVLKDSRVRSAMTEYELKRRNKQHGDGFYDLSRWVKDPRHPEGVRPEVEKEFANVVNTLNESPMRMRSTNIDKGKADGYWSRIIERGARSFESYVISKLAQEGRHNDFLANVVSLEKFSRDDSVYPYLTDKELVPVEKAFDKLFSTLKSKETDRGVMLYSKSATPNNTKGISVERAEQLTAEFFDRFPGAIAGTNVRVFSTAERAFGPDIGEREGSGIKGAYDPSTGNLILIASNIRDDADLAETLQHEIWVHKGLGLYSEKGIQAALNGVEKAIKNDPKVRKIWDEVQRNYSDRPHHIQLEEVLARVAEKTREGAWGRIWNDVLLAIRKALASLKIVKPLVKLPHLRKVIYEMADAFARGKSAGPRSDGIRFSNSPGPRPSAGVSSSGTTQEEIALDKLGLAPKSKKRLLGKILDLKTADLKRVAKDLRDRSYEGVFDGLVGLKRAEDAVGAGVAAGDYEGSGYVGARLATGVSDVMHHILNFGAVKWSGGVLQPVDGTRGILDIMADLGDDMTDWLAWMGGNRALELMKQGRENNLTKDDILLLRARARGKKAKFEKAKQEYNKINKAMLDMAEGAGLIKPDTRAEWESEWYVPFYRRSESDGNVSLVGPRTSRGLSHQSAGIKALKGGELKTNDLLENILSNWVKLADSSMKNSALLKSVDNLKGSEFIADETMHWSKVSVPRAEVVKRIKADRSYLEFWAESMGLDRTANELEVAHELNKLSTEGFEEMWRMVAPTDPDIIRVQRNGKNEYYRVADPTLLRAVSHLGFQGFSDPVTKTGRWFKRLLTTGVTASPDFMLRNFVRDAVHAWAINPDGFKLARSSITGLAAAAKKDSDYRALVASGAAFQGGYVHGTDPDASAQLIRRATLKKGLQKVRDEGLILDTYDKMHSAIQRGWQAYRNVGDRVENANRLATFKAALKAGKPMAQAVFESKDLMDYSLRGNLQALMWLTDMVPFLNARIQGLGKLGRAAAENPKSVAMKVGMLIGFSVFLASLNDDEERYDELPDWEKDAYWHIFVGDQHFRIPKPFEIGIIGGTIPERIWHTTIGEQESEKLVWSIKHNIWQTLGFNPVPQAAMPMIEVWGNRSFYFDTPIEGMSDEGKLPKARYNSRTSDSAVAIGQWLNMSPKKIEHIWEGYTGTMGSYALSAMDIAVRGMSDKPSKPAWEIQQAPVVKSFYRGDQNYSTQYLTDYYDMMEKAEQTYRTVKAFREEGREEDAYDLVEKNRDLLAKRKSLLKVRKHLGNVRNQMEIIELSDMSPQEKREQLDSLIQARNDYVRNAVKALKASGQ